MALAADVWILRHWKAVLRWLAMPLVVLSGVFLLAPYSTGVGGDLKGVIGVLSGGLVFFVGLAVTPARRWWVVLPVAVVLAWGLLAYSDTHGGIIAVLFGGAVGGAIVALAAARTLRLEGSLPTTLVRWLAALAVVVMLPSLIEGELLILLLLTGIVESEVIFVSLLLASSGISVLIAVGLVPLRSVGLRVGSSALAVVGVVYTSFDAGSPAPWIGAAFGGLLGLVLFVPERRPPAVETIYRWAAAGVALLTVNLIGYTICVALGDLPLFPKLAVAVSAGVSIVVATLVSQGRRGIREVAGVATLVWSLGSVAGVLENNFGGWGWTATLLVLAGIALGELVAFRLSHRDLRRVVPAAADRAQRYKGTASFEDRDLDRKTFFGRDRESRALSSLVLAQDLVVLFAKSGMGKTSLLNAGVLEPLRERGFFPIVARLNDVARGPSGSVIAGVRAAVEGARPRVELAGGDETSLERFFATAELWTETEDLLSPVLVIDQFEELFTLHEPAARDRFIEDLARLVRSMRSGASGSSSGGVDLKIVLSLREDFLADLEELAGEIPGVLRHRFRIGPLSVENARAAIVGPAGLADAAFDTVPFVYREKVLERILTFLTRQRRGEATVPTGEIEPVQLQLVCQYLEELVRAGAAAAGGEITDEDLGGEERLKQVLESFYDRTVESIRQPWRRFRVRRLCERRLISGSGRRLTQDGDEIVKKYGVPQALLRKLVDARLLRAEPRLGGTFYELSHDTLVEPVRRSRERRLRRAYAWGAGSVVLAAVVVGGWWLGQGRQAALEREEEAVVERLGRDLPSSEDAQLALAAARVEEIETNYGEWVRSSRMVSAMALAAADAATAHPEALGNRVARLFADLGDAVAANRRPPPQRAARLALANPGVKIEGGHFWMGSAADDSDARPHELPRHKVTLSDFWMQEHEVTNGEYHVFDRSYVFEGWSNEPARVNWFEAAAYALHLGGRLPTEAEWEYAARGGCASGDYCLESGEPAALDDLAWHANSSDFRIHAVKTLEPNQWGLYDIYGNVFEWCGDWYGLYPGQPQHDPKGPPNGSSRVLRGGSWRNDPIYLRGADRNHNAPENRNDNIGFRVVWSSS